MVFQDPMTSLDPVYRVGDQIVEQIRAHDRKISKAQALDRAVELMERVGIPRAAERAALLPARVLRRHAPARDDRDGAVVLAQAADRRRADDRARRDDPGADPRRAARAARRDRRRGHPRHPRPRRRRRHRRPGRRHVRRPRRRAGDARRASSTTRSTRTRGGCSGSITRIDRDRAQRLPAIPGMPPSLLRPPEGCHFRPRCPHAFDRCTEVPAARDRACPSAPDHLDRCWLEARARSARLRQVGDQIGLASRGDGDLVTRRGARRAAGAGDGGRAAPAAARGRAPARCCSRSRPG